MHCPSGGGDWFEALWWQSKVLNVDEINLFQESAVQTPISSSLYGVVW